MRLRPHHLIDIVSHRGHGVPFTPHEYGHLVHQIAEQVIADPDIEIEFIVGSDDICTPCRYLDADGRCFDVLRQCDGKPSKQDYNDNLDRRLFRLFKMEPGTRMTARAFLELIADYVPGLEAECSHPGEDSAHRLEGLRVGLALWGIVVKE